MADNVRRSPGRRRILDEARRQGVATILISCRCNPSLVCYCKPPHPNEETPPGLQPTRLDHPSSGAVGRRQPPRSRSRRAAAAAAAAARDPFGNLPPELLPTILSNLDVKESARTSLLSSAWRHAWKLSPKLTLDMVAICGEGYPSCKHGEEQYRAFLDRARYVQRFIDTVDKILGQRGRSVEQLELRFDDHHLPQVSSRLDDWIRRFAVSSTAKSVALHVSETPLGVYGLDQRYELPLQLLDAGGGVSSLRYIHLSHVSLKLPPNTQSIGFPSLKSLALHTATVSASDLQHILSNCPNLERLGLNTVYHLGAELRVRRPLPRLLYLRLVDCSRVTNIQLNADKLTTFIFRGHSLPTIHLGATSSGLRNVSIHCHELTLQQAVSSLPSAFPMMQRMFLSCASIVPMFPLPGENTSRFSHLRYLQLVFCIYNEHSAGALSIAYFLESAPLLEELDIKFVLCDKNGGEGPPRSSTQGQYEYKRLKCLRAREFTGDKDQLAVMLHVVESAPALEILRIDPIKQHASASFDPLTEAETTSQSDIRRRATTLIGQKLSAKTKFIVG